MNWVTHLVYSFVALLGDVSIRVFVIEIEGAVGTSLSGCLSLKLKVLWGMSPLGCLSLMLKVLAGMSLSGCLSLKLKVLQGCLHQGVCH